MRRRTLLLAVTVTAIGAGLSLADPGTGDAGLADDECGSTETATTAPATLSPTTPTDDCDDERKTPSGGPERTGAPAGGDGGEEPPDGPDGETPEDGESTTAGDDGGDSTTEDGPPPSEEPPADGAPGSPTDGETPADGEAPAGGPAPSEPGTPADGGAGTPGNQTTPGDGAGTPVPGDGGEPGNQTAPGPGNQTAPEEGTGPVQEQTEPVTGEPDLDAFAPNRTVEPGVDRRLTVSVVNSGTVDDGGTGTDPEAEQAVTTARNVRVTLTEGDAPVTVESGTVPLGDLRSGSVSRADFRLAVDDDADPGTYELDAEIEYEFTEEIDVNESDRDTETVTVPVELVVTEQGRFEVESVDSDLQVGEQGTVELDLENTGSADLTEASVLVRSQTGALLVDGSAGRQTSGENGGAAGAGASRFVGDWEAGDTESITFSATPTNRSATQEYALEAVVRYVDPDGDRRRSRDITFGVTPDEEQDFSLSDLDADLEVDADGTISGEITNEGPAPATDAAVRLVTGDDVAVAPIGETDATVVARREAVVLGDLDSGEDEDFELPVTVPDDAEPGDVQVQFVVDYLNGEGDPRESRVLRGAVEIDDEEPDFDLEDVDGDVQVGEEGTVSVTLSNEVSEDLTDARVSLTSRSDELLVGGGANASRFVGEWADGENETVTFDVTASNDSAVAEYPLTLRVAYTVDGDDERSDPIRTSVEPDAEQAFTISNVEATLRVGEGGTVQGRVENTGSRNVSNAAVVVTTGDETVTPDRPAVPLGDLDVDESEGFTYPLELVDDAEPGPRQLRFAVEYETDAGDRRRSDRYTVTVGVSAERDGFAVVDTTVETQVGDTGTFALTVANRRNESVTDARIALRSNSAELTVGGADNSTRFVGAWDSGENRTVEYELRAANDSAVQAYAVRALVAYRDDAGDDRESRPIRFGVVPLAAQTFTITNVTSTLRVAEEGVVEGRVRNEGPTNVTATVLRLRTDTETTNPQETEFALGDLLAGESSPFSVPVEITEDAAATPRLLSFRVAYADTDGDRTTSEELTARVRVRPERDRFTVRGVDAAVARGETGTVTLVVRNARNETLRDVNAKVFVDEPLDSGDDEAFVAVLDPNETVRLDFDLSAAGDASTRTVPLRVDFEYELPDGDTELSETYQVGINVTEPDEEGLIERLWPLGVVTLLALMGGLVGRQFWTE
ncbi:hypothetical protein [Halorientalis pallida]|uniref:Sialidase n=1 Tax=Halorientalis pallida TaxID=2479928 RepID=A0A498KZG2_9EURY|nr:hypothetical protein [Halorientalis pallida]RXK51430.1 hypothetical protein EAF64_01970 [Halorientalis pallida]